MKERPILFSAPMVRAILDGSKTQTRRIIKPQPEAPRCIYDLPNADTVITPKLVEHISGMGLAWNFSMTHLKSEKGEVPAVNSDFIPVRLVCPYGKPRDQLWVRETFTVESNRHIESEVNYPPPFDDGRPIFRQEEADDETYWRQCHYRSTDATPELMYENSDSTCIWKPSIHMPRWASRIDLEITSVRVERLNDCSEEDAIAEGIEKLNLPGNVWRDYRMGTHTAFPITSYQSLWESINGPGSWGANPWVWVVEFKRMKP